MQISTCILLRYYKMTSKNLKNAFTTIGNMVKYVNRLQNIKNISIIITTYSHINWALDIFLHLLLMNINVPYHCHRTKNQSSYNSYVVKETPNLYYVLKNLRHDVFLNKYKK